MSLPDAEAAMRRQQVRRLPVVDTAGALVGIVSLADIAAATISGAKGKANGALKDVLVETLQAISTPRNGQAVAHA